MRENNEIKIWLNDLTIHHNHGFGASEERKIRKVIAQYRDHFLAKWEDYCANI